MTLAGPHRREVLITMGTAAAAAAVPWWLTPRAAADEQAAADGPRSTLGLVAYCCGLQREATLRRDPALDLFDPPGFLEHCHQMGAGGMQVNLGVRDQRDCQPLRQRAEQLGMFIEAIVTVPRDEADAERFAAELRTAADCGATAARTTIIPGRRYEFFDSLEKYREFARRGRQSLEWALPAVERWRVPLAVENHKDQRIEERVALFQQFSSEYLGACVDTGNNIALLEDPLETVSALAPWAHSVHLKDQAVKLYDDGFLLGDIPLGQGALPLKQIVQRLRQQKPDLRFCLELITRDPLKVPVLQPAYWATFPDLPASQLARTLRFVREHSTDNLQYVSQLESESQLALETANVRQSLDYARDQLDLRPT